MQKLIRMKFVAILAITLIGQTPAFCQLGQRFSVQEAQNGANTEYNVVNSSSGIGLPFNIDAFVVETTGGNPSTTNPGWSAEVLDASSWLQSMGGTLSSWLDYTGKSYTQAFPNDPANVNGYVLNEPNMGGAISPDSSLNGFFFQGAPASTDRFMLVNVHGPAIVEGQMITDFGTVEVVPEPTTLSLFGIGILLLCRRMKRPNHTLEPLERLVVTPRKVCRRDSGY
jgi:hypothetical protein